MLAHTEGPTHKNTTTQPPHLLVLASYSILLPLPVKQGMR